MNPKFCSQCGTQFSCDARFCPKCGSASFQAPPVSVPEFPGSYSYAPAQKVTKKAKKHFTVGVVFLCIFFVIMALGLTALLNLRVVCSEQVLESSLKQELLKVDLTQIPATDLDPSASPQISVADYIAQEIENSYVVDVEVEAQDVQNFLEQSTILPFIAEHASELVTDFENGGITTEDLEELLLENSQEFEELVGIPLTEQDVEAVVTTVENYQLLDLMKTETIQEYAPVVYYPAQVVLSDNLLLAVGLAMLFTVLLILICRRWNIFYVIRDLGICLTVSGSICAAVQLIAMLLGNFITENLGGIVLSMLQYLISIGLILPAAVLLAGIIMIVFGGLCVKASKK